MRLYKGMFDATHFNAWPCPYIIVPDCHIGASQDLQSAWYIYVGDAHTEVLIAKNIFQGRVRQVLHMCTLSQSLCVFSGAGEG